MPATVRKKSLCSCCLWQGFFFWTGFTVSPIILMVMNSFISKEEKVFDALEWLAAMCSHVPNKGESRRWRESGIMGTTVT